MALGLLWGCSRPAPGETGDTETAAESADTDAQTDAQISAATEGGVDTATATESEGETESADVDTVAVYTDTHTYLSIDVGRKFVCGITTENQIACWGENEAVVSQVPPGFFVTLSAGKNHVCAIADSGEITCWGDNAKGQCDAPQGQFSQVAAGGLHSCAIATQDGSTVCWGDNAYGQTTPPDHQFAEIQAHEYSTCGLLPDKSRECWGGTGSPGNCSFPNADGPMDSFSLGSFVPKGHEDPEEPFCHFGYVSNGKVFYFGHPSFDIFPSAAVSQVVVGSVPVYVLLENGVLEAGWGSWCIPDRTILQQQNEAGGFVAAASAYGLTCGLRPDRTPICWADCASVEIGPPPYV